MNDPHVFLFFFALIDWTSWGYTVRVNDLVLAEGSGAVEITTSSMLMEIKAITEALRWLRQEKHRQLGIDDGLHEHTSKSTKRLPLCRLDGNNTLFDWIT